MDIVVPVYWLLEKYINLHNKVNEVVRRFVNQVYPIDMLIYLSSVSIVPSRFLVLRIKQRIEELLTNTVHQMTLKIQNNEYLKKSELGQKLTHRPSKENIQLLDRRMNQ